jgi:hypothetical protein
MDKKEIAGIFEEIGALLELRGDNPFRVRAYYNAARMVDGLQEDLGTLIKEERLTDIKGIGKDLAAKITELYTTNKLQFYDELKSSMPQGLLEMLRIPGFGPKRAKIVYDKLKVDSIEKLEAACKAGKIAALDGFGEKSQQKSSKASSSSVSSAVGIVTTRRTRSRSRSLRRCDRTTASSAAASPAACAASRNHRRHRFSRQRQTEGCGGDHRGFHRNARHPQRQRQGRDEGQRGAAGRHSGRPARGHRRPVCVCAELFHRQQGTQHRAAGPRVETEESFPERIRFLARFPKRRRARRNSAVPSSARPRRISTRRSSSTTSNPNCAKTWARSKRRRMARCRS